jgi:hypothetical protein
LTRRPDFLDLFLPAEACTALVLLALLFALRLPRARALLFGASLVATALAPIVAGYLPGLGLAIDTRRADALLVAAALLPVAATLLEAARVRRVVVSLVPPVGLFVLAQAIGGFVPALTAVQLTALAVLLALELPKTEPRAPSASSFLRDDAAVFILGALAALLVCDRVLQRYTLSGDEWADTWQADVFAHLRAYASPRPCQAAFRNWWVFEKDGRLFAQYTPGWPLVMAPFQRAGAPWLAAPVVFGATAVGVARLTRRVARAGLPFVPATAARAIRMAGLLGAAASIVCPSALLNGASRYPHTLVCACFAWMVEALFAVTETSGLPAVGWGAILGGATALAAAVRPFDGAAIAAGVLPFAFVLVFRRRVRAPGMLAAATAFAAVAALVLIVLRLQLGQWLTTGYSLSPFSARLNLPPVRDLAYAFRIDKGTGYWFPCSVPFLAAGLLAARGEARLPAWALFAGGAAHVGAYSLVELTRDASDSGYGPRFLLPLVVPMAVGTGLLLTVIAHRSRVGFGAVLVACAGGLVAVLAVVIPYWGGALTSMSALARGVRSSGLHHAVVLVHEGELAPQAWDLTQNLPSDPEPDVMIVTDRGAPDAQSCTRSTWPDRAFYVARQRYGPEGWGEVDFARLAP